MYGTELYLAIVIGAMISLIYTEARMEQLI